jgi:hypothetical protein
MYTLFFFTGLRQITYYYRLFWDMKQFTYDRRQTNIYRVICGSSSQNKI